MFALVAKVFLSYCSRLRVGTRSNLALLFHDLKSSENATVLYECNLKLVTISTNEFAKFIGREIIAHAEADKHRHIRLAGLMVSHNECSVFDSRPSCTGRRLSPRILCWDKGNEYASGVKEWSLQRLKERMEYSLTIQTHFSIIMVSRKVIKRTPLFTVRWHIFQCL